MVSELAVCEEDLRGDKDGLGAYVEWDKGGNGKCRKVMISGVANEWIYMERYQRLAFMRMDGIGWIDLCEVYQHRLTIIWRFCMWLISQGHFRFCCTRTIINL